MSGFAPLSYGTLGEWSRLSGRQPNTLEVEALFTLDAVLSSSGAPEKVEKE